MTMDNQVILDTGVVSSLWNGGEGSVWISRVASGQISAVICATSLADVIRTTPDRRSEIQLSALLSLVSTIETTDDIARRAGAIVRELDSEDPSATFSAFVAATALERGLPVACVDAEFFSAMGCEIATLD